MIINDIKSLLLKLNNLCTNSIQESAVYCVNRTNYEITIKHFFYKILVEKNSDIESILNYYNIDIERLKTVLIHDIEELNLGNSSKPVFSPMLIELIQDSWTKSSIDLKQTKIRSGSILVTLLNKVNYFNDGRYIDLLKDINKETLDEKFFSITKESIEDEMAIEIEIQSTPTNKETFLKKYCQDITQKAKDGKIDCVFGRDKEIRLMIDVLARRKKNNPICVGEPGVGKSAVVEGLALKIINDEVPQLLKNVRIIELDLTLLQAGAGMKGEFEKRLKGIITEIKNSPTQIILFIDEAHTLIGSGGRAGTEDAANLLKPALARGELRTIAATTWKEYKKYFEKDATLERRFQIIKLEEPSVETTILILRGIKTYYEKAHNVIIQDEAIIAAVKLSKKYIIGRFLPDKAIDLLDTASARIKINLSSKPPILEDKEQELKAKNTESKALQRDLDNGINIDKKLLSENKKAIKILEKEIKVLNIHWKKELKISHEIIKIKEDIKNFKDQKNLQKLKKELSLKNSEFEELKKEFNLIDIEINPDVIAKVVSDWTGIPLGKMLKNESNTILELNSNLKSRIKGQSFALDKISEIIRASKTGLKDPNHPMGVFLLVGPSGVGKTQTALELADLLFGNENSITIINMSEFQEKHTVSRLIGSPPGYVGYGEGGMLSEAIRKKPYSVLLLDEVEKAHPDIINLFYQVFDKGILTDADGKEISFKDTVIILASNLASNITENLFKDNEHVDIKELQEAIRPTLIEYFKPALLARMNVLPFKSLDKQSLKDITKSKLTKLQERLNNNKIELSFDESIIEFILSKALYSDSGARDIEHIINSEILPNISKEILRSLSENKELQCIKLSIENKELILSLR